MIYFLHSACISAQSGVSEEIPLTPALSEQNKLKAVEPKYEGIPNNLLRRMGRTTRMSIGAAMNCLSKTERLDGIVIGTANGGMEDCIKFMEQIVKYHETDLTPGNFVQSTPNGIAAQIALMKQNRGYNITHAHRGLSFENAIQDCMLLLNENPDH
ncbi:MAG: beta-ketoacyl synthase chain length factor, partial [Bacteroidia bacterium]|nr:beta-ketoacyl synthase chain length factor [Bacteroidia bacterium]